MEGSQTLEIEEDESGGKRETSPTVSDKDETRDSENGRRSVVASIIDEVNVKDLIGGSTADESAVQCLDLLDEVESDEEFLIDIQERQRTFDRLNRNMEKNAEKWKRLQEHVMLTDVSDDSYSRMIDGRINEIKSMCCNLVRPEYILDTMDPELKNFAVSLIPISRSNFEIKTREQWTVLDHFKYCGRMAHIFSLLAKTHLKYPWWEEAERKKIEGQPSPTIVTMKYSINKVLRLSLTTHPLYRSKSSIQQVLWFNRAIGAFSNLFPIEMEKELARYISYEIYDDGRVIRCQGDSPQKLYYILAGKIEMVKVYRLSDGEVHKSMGFLAHKNMTDFEDFEMGNPAPTYLVARNRVEVLSLHREDYSSLTSQTNIDSIRTFLEQMSVFKEMPVTQEALQSQLVKMQYFRQEKVITSDSPQAAYLYIVKSGKVAVARQQTVFDKNIGTLLNSKNAFSLGCNRDGKHATDMLGLPRRQRDFKDLEVKKTNSTYTKKSECKTIQPVKPHTMIGTFNVDVEETFIVGDLHTRSQTLFDIKRPRDILGNEEHQKITEILAGVSKRRQKERQTYVKLDSLRPLEIFGLDSLEATSRFSGSKLVLISEGAEVLMISKRYFLESVNNNTLLEIRKLIKSYINEEEVKVMIDEDEKWQAYKRVLMQRMISLHC